MVSSFSCLQTTSTQLFFRPLLAQFGIILQNVKKVVYVGQSKGNLFSAISNCILWKTIWKQPITVYNAKHSVFCIRQTHQNWRGYLKIFFNADSITFLYVLQIPWCLVWWDNIKFPVFFPSSYSKQEHHWSSCSRSQNKVSL